MAIMISIPAGAIANQERTLGLTENLGNTISQTSASINETLTQIDCTLTPSFEGFGFTQPPDSSSGFTPPGFGSGSTPPSNGNFTPGQFGGGSMPGQFGGGPVRGWRHCCHE